MKTVGQVVHKIQASTDSDTAVQNYSVEATTFGLSDKWIRSVYYVKKKLPILDLSVDVHGNGTTILTQMNISPEVQTRMWEKWPTLPEDVRAAWVEDFKELDFTDQRDVTSYVTLLIDLLS